MGAQLEHLKEVKEFLFEISSPTFIHAYFRQKKSSNINLSQYDGWSPVDTLGKFTQVEKGFRLALAKTFTTVTDSEKEFGGQAVHKSLAHFTAGIKPMLEVDVMFLAYSRTYPEEKLTRSEVKQYHHFISTKYVNKLEQAIYAYELDNFPDVAIKPKSPFTMRENVNADAFPKIHARLLIAGYTDSSADTFTEFIMNPDVSKKLNWLGTYEELWCFILGMFSLISEMPLGLSPDVIKWKDYTEDCATKDKKKFSTWLNNTVLPARISVKGEKFEKKQMHLPQNSTAKIQDQLRKKLAKIITG